jgi:hypothetical protein
LAPPHCTTAIITLILSYTISCEDTCASISDTARREQSDIDRLEAFVGDDKYNFTITPEEQILYEQFAIKYEEDDLVNEEFDEYSIMDGSGRIDFSLFDNKPWRIEVYDTICVDLMRACVTYTTTL